MAKKLQARSASRGAVVWWVLATLAAIGISVMALRASSSGQFHTERAAGGIPDRSVYQENDEGVLFQLRSHTGLPDEQGLVPHQDADAGQRYVVGVSRQAAEDAAASKGQLMIQLPSGERFGIRFERSEYASNGNWTFIGKVSTQLGPQAAVLTFGPAGVFGVLPIPQGSQMQLTTTRGVTVLEPLRPMHPRDPATGELPIDYVIPPAAAQPVMWNGLTQEVPAVALAPPPVRLLVGASSGAKAVAAASAAVPADPVQVDVLGLYTKNMVELRGSVAAAETEVQNYLAVANQAHRDSNTGITLKYVGLQQVDYPATALNETALADLRANTMPDGTDVQALRESLRADLVALHRPYVSGDTNGGIGYLGSAGGYDGAAFSVSNLSTYTFAHETGHNLGSMHDIVTSTTNGVVSYGAFAYSFGYRQDGPPAFATIMAYPANGQPQIGYFSHPGTTACLGVACGTEEADNARSLRNMAPVVSEYRLPPNLISVSATPTVEGDPGSLWARTATVTVKLSTPAPVGGVRFDIGTKDGSALAGADYAAWSQSAGFSEGESSRSFTITLLPDALIEGEESFEVVLTNVQGAGIYRASTDVRIIDDDPRLTVSGRFTAPPGMAMPSSQFQIGVAERSVNGYQSASYWVSPPGFEYSVPVQSGSSVTLETFLNAPYADASYDLGVINQNLQQDLVLKRSFRLTGALRFPAGQPVPTSAVTVVAWGATGSTTGSAASANPPDFKYAFDVVEGAELRLDARDPPSPYVRQQVALGEIRGDRAQDITLGSVPSLVMTGARVVEGGSAQETTVKLNLYLSISAPAEGVQVDVEVQDGSAVAGSDFVAQARRRVTIGAGNNFISFPVVIKGDATPEGPESFKVVLSNPSGAWLPSPQAIVHIEDDDFGLLRNDFNGDGRSDVFWRNLVDGRNVIWWSAVYGQQSNPGAVTSQAWSVVGNGDFDGDGKSDLFWRNAANGQNIIWPSGNGSLKRSVTTITGLDWRVVAVGDFDGDGRSDVFWRHQANGQNAIWWSGRYETRSMVQSIFTDWKVVGTGDIDGDGEDDVLWRNSITGANVVWWSGSYATRTNLVGVANQAWEVVAIGDFVGDGMADVFWRNRGTGENIIWWNGNYSTQVREAAVAVAWKIVAAGDYDGNGDVDLFWRNAQTGANIIWDSARYAGRRSVTGVASAAWVVQQ